MLVTTTNNFFEKQQTVHATKDSLVALIRQNERTPIQIFEQVNFFNRVYLDIEKIDPVGFEESSIFKIADLFTRYVEKVVDISLEDSSFIVTKNNASLSYHVIFNYALDSLTIRSVVALFKALYPWAGIIDDVVYSRGRLFKCVGSYKPGTMSTEPANPETYHVVVRPCGARVPLSNLSDEEIASSLISNLDGAKVISILETKISQSQNEMSFTTTRTIDKTPVTFNTKFLHYRTSLKYSVVNNASEVNEIFAAGSIARVEANCGFVKRSEYIELGNYFNNYNLCLKSTENLKVYDGGFTEITENLDRILLRCLLSRDIRLFVKSAEYAALSGDNIHCITSEQYSNFRKFALKSDKLTARVTKASEGGLKAYILQKFYESGVGENLINYQIYSDPSCEPKPNDNKRLYSLADITEVPEFLYLESERYKDLYDKNIPNAFRTHPSWYFTKNDYISNSSNMMFKLFVNEQRSIGLDRKTSNANPYSKSLNIDESDDESDDEPEDKPVDKPADKPEDEPEDKPEDEPADEPLLVRCWGPRRF